MNRSLRYKRQPCDVMLVDCMNLCYRCLYSQGKLKSKDTSTGVIYGVTNLLKDYIQKFSPKNVYMVGEGRNSHARRRELYSGYKVKPPMKLPIPKEEFYAQIEYLKDLWYNLGVNYVAVDNFEADDVIAVLSREYKDKNVIIVSTDGDYLQLVSKNLSVYNPTKDVLITTKNFTQEVGVDLGSFLSYKCMVGDASDKIKGIVGCGPIMAKEIVGWMGYELFLESGIENIPKHLQKAFTIEAQEQYKLAGKLIDLSEVPLDFETVLDKIVFGAYIKAEAQDLLEDVEMWGFLDNWSLMENTFGNLEAKDE